MRSCYLRACAPCASCASCPFCRPCISCPSCAFCPSCVRLLALRLLLSDRVEISDLLVVLVGEVVGAYSAGHHTAHGTQDTTTQLVSNESTTSASHQGRSETAIFGSAGTSWSSRLAILALLVLWVPLVTVALLRGRAIRLLLRRVGRVAAVRIMRLLTMLVVVAGGRSSVALLLLVRGMRWWWTSVRALQRVSYCTARMSQTVANRRGKREMVLTCWGGYGLCWPWLYWS